MTRIITEAVVRQVLTMTDGIRIVEDAFRQHGMGRTSMTPRMVIPVEGEAGGFRIMAASLPDVGMFGLKTLTGTPGRRRSGSTYFAILMFDGDTGALAAVLSAAHITGVRTGASGGVAVSHLARADARHLAVIGAGVQARAQVAAIRLVRPIERLAVYDVDGERARAFAADIEASELSVCVVSTARDAVRGSDIVVTATTAKEPFIEGKWLEKGTHVNAIGANTPTKRELSRDTFARGRLILDYREQALAEAGDLMDALDAGAIDDGATRTELGAVVAGLAPGRESEEQITIFKSVGAAFQDIGVAAWVAKETAALEIGLKLHLEGDS